MVRSRTPPKPSIKPKTLFRRERFVGEITNNVRNRTNELLHRRAARSSLRSGVSAVSAFVGGAVPAAKAIAANELLHGDVKRAFATIFSAAAIGGIMGAAVGHAARSRAIRHATLELKDALHAHCKAYDRQNPFSDPLIDFLFRYKYVLVDRKGYPTGTNMPRLVGIGRMRIATSDVLPLVLVKARENSSKK